MIKKLLLGLVAVIAVFCAVVATQPATFHVERSATVPGPPEVAYDIVNDFHRFGEWSPWEKLDPNMKKTFEGPKSGVGGKYTWTGNDDVGAGSMEIISVEENKKVTMDLHFLKPFEASNKTTYSFAAEGTGTKVTWAMDGENNFMAKAFGLLMDMDKMVGGDFERGLASLGTVAEAEVKQRAEDEAAAIREAKALAAEAEAAAAAGDETGDAGAP